MFISSADENVSIVNDEETYVITCKSRLPNKGDISKSHEIKDLIFKRSVKELLSEQKSGVMCEDDSGKMYLLLPPITQTPTTTPTARTITILTDFHTMQWVLVRRGAYAVIAASIRFRRQRH